MTSGGGTCAVRTPVVRAGLLGDFHSPEFAGVAGRVRTDTEVVAFGTPEQLLEQVSGGVPIELLLVAQARPGQWHGAWLERLRRQAPLVRTTAVLGTWCTGETRTGRPLAADLRIFWHAFPNWWVRQVKALRAGAAADWSYPGERSGAAILAAPGSRNADLPLHERNAYPTSGAFAIVAARNLESAEAVGLALRAGGWSSVWVRRPRQLPHAIGASAIIYDGSRLDEEDLGEIERLRNRYGPLPVVALSDLPTISRTAACGSLRTAVLGKPFVIEDFLQALGKEVAASEGLAVPSQRAG